MYPGLRQDGARRGLRRDRRVVRDARQGREVARRPLHQGAADPEPRLSGDRPADMRVAGVPTIRRPWPPRRSESTTSAPGAGAATTSARRSRPCSTRSTSSTTARRPAHARRGSAGRRPLLLAASSATRTAPTRRRTAGASTSRGSCCGRESARAAARGHPACASGCSAIPELLGPARLRACRRSPTGPTATALLPLGCVERWLGIDRRRRLPRYARSLQPLVPAPDAAGRRRAATARWRSSYTTPVEYNAPETGRAAVRGALAERHRRSSYPEQVCCGMPALDARRRRGRHAARPAQHRAASTARSTRAATSSSRARRAAACSSRSTRASSRATAAERVASHVFDLAEYLMRLHADGQARPRASAAASAGWPTTRPVISACRRSASRRATCCGSCPDTSVEVLERCTGMDGTWGFKHEFYDDVGARSRGRCCASSTSARPT